MSSSSLSSKLSTLISKATATSSALTATATVIGVGVAAVLFFQFQAKKAKGISEASVPVAPSSSDSKSNTENGKEEKTSIMQSEVEGLKREQVPFKLEELKEFDGKGKNPIYVSIKGLFSSFRIFFPVPVLP